MTRYKSLISCILFLIIFRGFSQDVFRIGSANEFLRPKDIKSSNVSEIYLDTTWTITDIITAKDEKVENVLTRYELRANHLEVKTSKGVGVLDAGIIKSYAFEKLGKQHEFINAQGFTFGGTQLLGMIEMLSDGKIPLCKRYRYFIKKPDYNPALAVGNASEQLFIEDDLYYGAGKALIKLPTKRKKLLEIFGDKAAVVQQYVDKNKVNISSETGLIAVFNFFNTL